MHAYEDRPRKDHRGVHLISDALPFGLAPLMKALAQRLPNIIDVKKRARRVLKASLNLVQQRWGKSDRHKHSTRSIHIYEIRPRADRHGFDLSGDTLRYSPLWYRGSNPIVDAVRYARSYSRSHRVVIYVYDPTSHLVETLEYKGESTISSQERHLCQPEFQPNGAV